MKQDDFAKRHHRALGRRRKSLELTGDYPFGAMQSTENLQLALILPLLL